ncbi:zonular occludens toxin domain-containing protein [Heyndrickxia sporothermodurans]|uniref:zonular occludens toxin domain-containing protein n=1 Tax=Heyndrickxia sporothermodurans TaxID=46224 RepID=UPI002E2516F3|nr:zonular occludens toxin domain-containing protein [Heyndrickxia sporothermodurans]
MKKKRFKKYSLEPFFKKIIKFYYWIFKDMKFVIKYGKPFNEFGVTLYCGKQGAGKTMAMTEYLLRMRYKYPKCKIYTNFGFKLEDGVFNNWNDFFDIRNGEDGVIFAIDEIQNEFNSTAWKNFPESLLSEITQQRKQRIKIVSTSQVFTRVAKPLREQTFEVVECYTFGGRWTFTKAFDAQEYEAVISQPVLKNKLHRLWRKNFIQDNYLRDLYNSYDKVERMKKTTYLDRSERIG